MPSWVSGPGVFLGPAHPGTNVRKSVEPSYRFSEHGHSLREGRAGHSSQDSYAVHVQLSPGQPALESLVVVAEPVQVHLLATDEEEAVEISTVRVQEEGLERLDLASLLELTEVLHSLAKASHRAGFAAASRPIPSDEKCAVRHVGSPRFLETSGEGQTLVFRLDASLEKTPTREMTGPGGPSAAWALSTPAAGTPRSGAVS